MRNARNMKPVTDREGFIRRGWLIPALRAGRSNRPLRTKRPMVQAMVFEKPM
jgi:hypothetical protein